MSATVINLAAYRRHRPTFARDRALLEAEIFGRAGNYEASGARSAAFWKDLFNDGGDAFFAAKPMPTDEIERTKP